MDRSASFQMRDVEDLDVFKLAHELVLRVYQLTRRFPQEELYGLVSQLRRASVSVTANLVEGSQRAGRAEFKHFVSLSRGSAAEVKYELRVSRELGIGPEAEIKRIEDDYTRVLKMLSRLYASLRDNSGSVRATSDEPRVTQQGFTLLEMVIVIVLVAVLAAIAISRLSGTSRVKIDQASRMLAGDLQLARDVAMTNATSVRIIFDLTSETYGASYYSTDANDWRWISSLNFGSSLWVTMTDFFEDVDISDFYVDSASVTALGYSSFAFSSMGVPRRAYDGGSLTGQNRIDLTFGGFTQYVSVQPQTGYVYVCSQ